MYYAVKVICLELNVKSIRKCNGLHLTAGS